MIKQSAYTFLLCLFFLGCNVRPEQDNRALQSYFDLESFLDEQVEMMLAQEAGVEKNLESNGRKDEIIIEVNSAEEWKDQLSLFYEANIDQPGYQGAFEIDSLNSEGLQKVLYEAKDEKTPVQRFECNYQDGELVEIHIDFIEKNLVYNDKKTLSLFMQGERLVGYSIQGNEAMRLKEDMIYSVEAVITY